jgi:hypothetical protein
MYRIIPTPCFFFENFLKNNCSTNNVKNISVMPFSCQKPSTEKENKTHLAATMTKRAVIINVGSNCFFLIPKQKTVAEPIASKT